MSNDGAKIVPFILLDALHSVLNAEPKIRVITVLETGSHSLMYPFTVGFIILHSVDCVNGVKGFPPSRLLDTDHL
jgi:hypothetical protein